MSNLSIVLFDSSSDYKTYNVVDSNNTIIAYYYEYYVNPETNEKLDNTVYEIYYDYDDETEDYLTSTLTDDYDDILEVIDSLETV